MRVELWVTRDEGVIHLWDCNPLERANSDWLAACYLDSDFERLFGFAVPSGDFCRKLVIDGTMEWESEYVVFCRDSCATVHHGVKLEASFWRSDHGDHRARAEKWAREQEDA